MIIALDLARPGSYVVENFNDAETLLTTPSLRAAAGRAAREAHHYDAVVNLRLGDGPNALTLQTGPRRLLWKALAAHLAFYFLTRFALNTTLPRHPKAAPTRTHHLDGAATNSLAVSYWHKN